MSKRERTIAILLGVVVLLFVLDRMFFSPLMEREAIARERVVELKTDLSRADQSLLNEKRARRRWEEMAGDTLKPNAPQAESQLLNHTREWAQQAGLTLNSLTVERTESEEGFGKITARAGAAGGMQQLARFLYAVQTGPIPVRVADITVNSRTEGSDDLNVQIGLSTIYLPPEAEPDGAGTEARR